MSNFAHSKINLGMYAETLIQRSCDYYRLHNIAFIEKRQLPIKIIKRINETTIIGKLLNKSYVDFFGCHQGKHIEFEVKETGNDNLTLSILKPHQFEYLELIAKHNIECFLIVYFSKYDEIYRIDFPWILKYIRHHKIKQISYENIKTACQLLPIIFPGIVNFLQT